MLYHSSEFVCKALRMNRTQEISSFEMAEDPPSPIRHDVVDKVPLLSGCLLEHPFLSQASSSPPLWIK